MLITLGFGIIIWIIKNFTGTDVLVVGYIIILWECMCEILTLSFFLNIDIYINM